MLYDLFFRPHIPIFGHICYCVFLLQGVRFDPESNITLRLEFAHANSRTSPRYINGVPMGTTMTPNRNTCKNVLL